MARPRSHKPELGEQRVRIHGEIAIDTETHTFFESRDSKDIVRVARFSFVFHNRGGRWLIVDHQFSAVPAAAQ